jgi:hypothetical protein
VELCHGAHDGAWIQARWECERLSSEEWMRSRSRWSHSVHSETTGPRELTPVPADPEAPSGAGSWPSDGQSIGGKRHGVRSAPCELSGTIPATSSPSEPNELPPACCQYRINHLSACRLPSDFPETVQGATKCANEDWPFQRGGLAKTFPSSHLSGAGRQ